MEEGLFARFGEACREDLPRIVALRRSFHENPEIGLDLPLTSALVAAELDRLGLAYRRVGSGLIAELGDRGPVIGLRADMDALPIEEKTLASYASKRGGAMHACGHDAHMASLLGAAGFLVAEEKKGRLGFRPRLLFQVGEEGFFGAKELIAAGALEGMAAIEGGHVGDLTEELAPGEAGFLPGPMLAASDSFGGSFVGSGGHGSAPHNSPDPIAAFADFIQALEQFRARELDQRKPAVVSICSVSAGKAYNVIPERLDFKGTARSLEAGLRKRIEERIAELGASVAARWKLGFEWDWLGGYPPMVNDPVSSDAIEAAARRLLGPPRVKRLAMPIMGGEDFAFYLERLPGAFWFLNSQAPERGITWPNHNPRFDLDEALLADAAALHLSSAYALAALHTP
jgi:amidohydrolase